MENSSEILSSSALLTHLSLPSKTQNLVQWLLSIIIDLVKAFENLKIENRSLKEELGGVHELLEQKDKVIQSLTRRNQELENRLNTNSTNSNRPPSTDSPFVGQSMPSSQPKPEPTSETADSCEDQDRH